MDLRAFMEKSLHPPVCSALPGEGTCAAGGTGNVGILEEEVCTGGGIKLVEEGPPPHDLVDYDPEKKDISHAIISTGGSTEVHWSGGPYPLCRQCPLVDDFGNGQLGCRFFSHGTPGGIFQYRRSGSSCGQEHSCQGEHLGSRKTYLWDWRVKGRRSR